MAFPHDQDGAGDIKSLRRAAWAHSDSNYLAYAGGRAGGADYNWDQPEGFMRRIDNHNGGTDVLPQNPFDIVLASTNNSDDVHIQQADQGGLTSLERTDEFGNIVESTTAKVIRLQNGTGNHYGMAAEVFTNRWSPVQATSIIAETPNDGQWYLSFYARKPSSSSPTPVTATVFIFGVAQARIGSAFFNYYTYDGQYASLTPYAVDATTSTINSPATNGTYYYTNTGALASTWTKYDMCFKFNGTPHLTHMTCRLDNNIGQNSSDPSYDGSDSFVFFDRLTLHPMNVAMSEIQPSTANASMASSIYGTYQ